MVNPTTVRAARIVGMNTRIMPAVVHVTGV
jgi:hypothetical protein